MGLYAAVEPGNGEWESPGPGLRSERQEREGPQQASLGGLPGTPPAYRSGTPADPPAPALRGAASHGPGASRGGILYPVNARLPIAFFLCLALAQAARAEGGLLPDGHLDTAAVREAYLRSDIPFVRSALEGFLKNHPKDVATAEKVFTHLYLGATFAGDPEGRDRSERHFRAALKFAPDADPSGLYLPPAAGDWFESLRLEARSAARSSATGAIEARAMPEAGAPGQEPGPSPSPPALQAPAQSAIGLPEAPKGDLAAMSAAASPAAPPASEPLPAITAGKSRAWIWWALGGGAALAAGTGALVLSESRSGTSPHRVQVDATLK
jgi:hypothetical protein